MLLVTDYFLILFCQVNISMFRLYMSFIYTFDYQFTVVGRDGVAGDRVQQVVEAEVGHGDGHARPLDP